MNGQTPLDDDEKEGLLIPTITTRKELDEFEQQNIEQAIKWTLATKFKKEQILTEAFVKQVHKKMYGEVWAWAGTFRKTNKNIGIESYLIPTELKKLLDDCEYWVNHNTYPPDEIAIRFKHRIVQIHCFSNGNGRHSRLMGDLIIDKIFNKEIFTWGGNADLISTGNEREIYLKALKNADLNNFKSLLEFART